VANVANLADLSVKANEKANEDVIALSGGKLNCCIMITLLHLLSKANTEDAPSEFRLNVSM